MRISKRFLFFFFITAFIVHAQSPNAISAIKAVLHQQEKAWNSGDLSAFMEGYWESDSLVFVGSKGPTYGYANTYRNYQKGYPDQAAMGKLTFTLKHIKQWDAETVQVIGGFVLVREKDAPSGYFTLLFRRFEEGWKIVSDHSSSGQ